MSESVRSACCVIRDIGFYHHARMQATGAAGPCTVIEVQDRSHFPEFRYTPGADANYAVVSMNGSVSATLAALRPDVVFLPGWSDRDALDGLRWCLKTGTPAVCMSESTRYDAAPDDRTPDPGRPMRRRWWREAIKRQIVPLFSAALVGGMPHREYVVELGMSPDRVFDGYDAVDNDYYATGADAARSDIATVRAKHSLPERYFLASARWIPKKNFGRLVRAFAAYRVAAGSAAWNLVLLGDGPEKPTIDRLVDELKIGPFVHRPGFKTFTDLPAYYGLAGAFVHPSTTEQWGLVVNEAMASALPVIVSRACGCATDLVTDGVTGFKFDPYNEAELSKALLTVADAKFDCAGMGRAARTRVSEWGPDRFAFNFWRAAEIATKNAPARRFLLGRILVGFGS
jgi:glycosyltransferase involved in cell wall biosynthesis